MADDPKPSRRALLAGAAAGLPVLGVAADAAAAPATAAADAALLAACDDVRAADRECERVDHGNVSRAEVEAAAERWTEAVRRAAEIPATTDAGTRAKAEALRIVLRREVDLFEGTFEAQAAPHERLAMSLAGDVLALAGGAP